MIAVLTRTKGVILGIAEKQSQFFLKKNFKNLLTTARKYVILKWDAFIYKDRPLLNLPNLRLRSVKHPQL